MDILKLRGAQNGAFRTYERSGIDDWDLDQVLNDPELVGFSKPKKNENPSENEKTKQQKKQNNTRGLTCRECGNIMKQTASNCYECKTCGDKLGGCGQ